MAASDIIPISVVIHSSMACSTDSSVGIATGWKTGVRFPTGTVDFPRLYSAQTSSEAHPVSFPMGTVRTLPGAKLPERNSYHSILRVSSAEVKKMWIYTSTSF
jgi:hypothetical protein